MQPYPKNMSVSTVRHRPTVSATGAHFGLPARHWFYSPSLANRFPHGRLYIPYIPAQLALKHVGDGYGATRPYALRNGIATPRPYRGGVPQTKTRIRERAKH